jgi:hypothetical protein
MLAHNITALFVVPFLALYLVGMAWIEGRIRRLAPAAAAGALGLGLSAFYWLPALAEREYAQIERWMLGGDFSAADNLVGLSGLVHAGWRSTTGHRGFRAAGGHGDPGGPGAGGPACRRASPSRKSSCWRR